MEHVQDSIRRYEEREAQLKRFIQVLQENENRYMTILNSLPILLVVLDASGYITFVNQEWERHSIENDISDPSLAGVGINYLKICRSAIDQGCDDVRPVYEGILSVLEGKEQSFTHEYLCSSPTGCNRFQMIVTPVRDGKGGVIIMHLEKQ
ncbi:conserved hypothetical protein [Heliomicrobium modesticaldum Ice1]|uniref:PAS domain-containing protein n=1 Tax=Heliobacterium modesticaldum (strain ATCC 51547 / Ice1) TaxID=498761 RepID=B0TCA2_HELMI|nr:PAS domain-containing protein [Heliomicrobium modesticaldum]ABZ84001.1 conserved hypothetical protein [Heliomicrobium modesticaldum Ice1]